MYSEKSHAHVSVVSNFSSRRGFFIITYFVFFYNTFLGVISCLLRIIKAIVLGALFLGRLDHSTLPRRFQLFDPGNYFRLVLY